jgi:hypothetical protein
MLIHTKWLVESDPTKGHRATVSIFPSEEANACGVKRRRLRGPWINTGVASIDESISRADVVEQLAILGIVQVEADQDGQ